MPSYLWDFHIEEVCSQFKFEFDIITGTLTDTSKWSPGAAVDFNEVKIVFFFLNVDTVYDFPITP